MSRRKPASDLIRVDAGPPIRTCALHENESSPVHLNRGEALVKPARAALRKPAAPGAERLAEALTEPLRGDFGGTESSRVRARIDRRRPIRAANDHRATVRQFIDLHRHPLLLARLRFCIRNLLRRGRGWPARCGLPQRVALLEGQFPFGLLGRRRGSRRYRLSNRRRGRCRLRGPVSASLTGVAAVSPRRPEPSVVTGRDKVAVCMRGVSARPAERGGRAIVTDDWDRPGHCTKRRRRRCGRQGNHFEYRASPASRDRCRQPYPPCRRHRPAATPPCRRSHAPRSEKPQRRQRYGSIP